MAQSHTRLRKQGLGRRMHPHFDLCTFPLKKTIKERNYLYQYTPRPHGSRSTSKLSFAALPHQRELQTPCYHRRRHELHIGRHDIPSLQGEQPDFGTRLGGSDRQRLHLQCFRQGQGLTD